MNRKAVLLALSAGAVAALPLSMAIAAMPPAQAWEIGPMVRGKNYSVGMPANPRPGPEEALVMDFPLAGRGQVDAMTTAAGSLAGARSITLTYRIDAAPPTRFVPDEVPDGTATVSLYFQRAGDTWSAKGRYASYRWYSPAHAVVPLAPGMHTIKVRFDEEWTNVYGKSNRSVPGLYAAAMRESSRIGLAFGSAGGRSHGVYATGPARFTLLNWKID